MSEQVQAPTPVSDPIRLAVMAEHDQLRTDELDLGSHVTIAVGIRNAYIRLDGNDVAIIPISWR